MSINRFGNFFFVSFHRPDGSGSPPEILCEQTEVVQRPGSNGAGVILLGRKGKPFQMRSFVDTETFADAEELSEHYIDVIGTGPYGIIWGGINFLSRHDVVYVPLAVEGIKLKQLRASAGGLYPPSLGSVEALWTLLPVEVPPAPPEDP
jgi:hypothetical protein